MLFAFFGTFYIAHANPSFFLRNQTANATTTLSYLTPGAATSTTPTFDLGAGGGQGGDSAILALALTGSTTPSNATFATTTYSVAIEYSQGGNGNDCVATPTSCDWYADGMFPATTTTSVGISGTKVHTITLGTETLNGIKLASTTPTKVLYEVPAPTRYVRAVISVVPGANATNGAVWAEFIAKRQNP